MPAEPGPLRVVILEDRPDDAELLVHSLRQAGFAPEWRRVDTREAYLPRTNEVFSQLLQRPGASFTSEFRCRHLDGSWRWIEGTGTNLLYEPGVHGVVANYRDIGPRKRAETTQRFLAEASHVLAASL